MSELLRNGKISLSGEFKLLFDDLCDLFDLQWPENVSGSYLLIHRGVRKKLWTVSSSIIWKWKVEGETWKGCGRWVETAYLPSPHTNVSIYITWDLRLPLNRFSSFQTYTCKMKTKWRQIWPPHQATKGPATPLCQIIACFSCYGTWNGTVRRWFINEAEQAVIN